MKKCYQLIYRLTDGSEHDVIFADKQKAYDYLSKFYKVGQTPYNKKIISSTVVERILF